MTPADIARFHSDPANWKLGIFYYCRSDQRILVPKRILGLGWTPNFGRPMAVPFLVFFIALIPCAAILARFLGAGSETRYIIALLVTGGVLTFFHRLTHRPAKTVESESPSEVRNP